MVASPSGPPPTPWVEFSLANASFVTERLAVGGDLSPNFGLAKRQLDELVAAGITHIADLREEWSDETLVKTWEPQLKYLHHRVADAGQEIGGAWFDALADWVDAALAEPGSKVLVHCHMGVNRAPSAVLALMLNRGIGLRPALDAETDIGRTSARLAPAAFISSQAWRMPSMLPLITSCPGQL